MTSSNTPRTWKKHHTAAAPRAWTLEARLMFDGAAVADAVHQLASATDTHVLDLQRGDAVHPLAAPAAPSAPSAERTAPPTPPTTPPDATASGPDMGIAETASPSSPIDRLLSPTAAPAGSHEILFIDGSLPGLDVLLSHIRADVQVVVLDATRDPWAQMSAVVEQQSDISAIHLVSHGQGGDLILGGHHYTQTEVQARAAELQQWQGHLTAQADILLYGCDVAAGQTGQSLINTLATLTQADVTASTDATGATALGGNWVLEAQTGTIEASGAFSARIATDYAYDLTAGTFSSKTGTNVDTAGVTSGLIGAGKLITFDPIAVTTVDPTAKLVIRAYDVDYGLKTAAGSPVATGDPASEWDGVYIQKAGDTAWTFVGYLNGTNNNWSYSTLDISAVVAAKGVGNYLVRVTPDDNGTQTQTSNGGKWVVGTSNASIVLGSGGTILTTVTEVGQQVTSTFTPVVAGNYTIQYLLIDSTGRAVAQVDAAANGLAAGVATTLSSTLATNGNFYGSWSALPTGSYTLQATLFDANGAVQDTKETSYAVVQAGGSGGAAGAAAAAASSAVTISGLKTWYGSSLADTSHQATSDSSSQQLTLKGVLATKAPNGATLRIQELVNGTWTAVSLKSGTRTTTTNPIAVSRNATSWSVNLSNDLSVGTHTLRAGYTSGGNTVWSASYKLVVDTPSTLTPVITDLSSASWLGGSTADLASQASHALRPHTSADATPALTGTAGALSTLNVYDGSTLLGYTTADASGVWTFQVPDYLQRSNGTHSFTVKDVGNNKTSTAYALTIDSTAPQQTITINSISADTGSSASDFITATAAQTIQATLSASLGAGQRVLGSLDGGVNWTDVSSSVNGRAIAWANQSLSSGYADPSQYVPWAIQFKVVDANNQAGAVASQDYQLLQSGGTPVLTTIARSGAASVTTNSSVPVFTGSGDANTQVDVFATSGGTTTLIGTAAVNTAGVWTLAPGSAIANGTYTISVVERNALSGYSANGVATKALTINTALPTLTLNAASDSGTYTNDLITTDTTPSVRVNFANLGVTLVNGDSVEIWQGGSSVGVVLLNSTTATTANTNHYVDVTTTTTLASNTTTTLSAKVIHAATPYLSNDLMLTLDTSAPVLASARIDGQVLRLAYTEAVGLTGVGPDLAAYSVQVNGATAPVDSLLYDPVGNTVTLLLNQAVNASDSVTVSYLTSTTNRLGDLAGNRAAALTTQAVANLTDTSAPTLASIALLSPASGPSNASSVTFRVTFADASGGVTEVDAADFIAGFAPVSGAPSTLAIGSVTQVSDLVYDITVSDASLAGANGTLTLSLATAAQGMAITDLASSPNAMADDTGTTASVVLDHSAPTAALLSLNDDTGASATDRNTAKGQLDVTGIEVGATWQFRVNGGAWTDGTPGTSVTISASALGADGAKVVQLRQTDAAGNTTTSELAFTLDTAAPTFVSAAVDGAKLTLTLDDASALDAISTLDLGAFAIGTDAITPITVLSAAVDAQAHTVTLTLDRAVQTGEAVTLTYTDPSAGNDPHALQDLAGNDFGATGIPLTEAVDIAHAPVLTLDPLAGSLGYTEGGTPRAIGADLTLSDADLGDTLASATVRVTGVIDANDVLAFVNDGLHMGNISASWDASTQTLRLSSAGLRASPAEWQAALAAVTFFNGSDAPVATDRTLEFRVNDGQLWSEPLTRTLSLTAVNDAPTLDTPATQLVTQNTATALTGISLADVDAAPTDALTLTVHVDQGTLNATSGSGVTATGDGSTTLTLHGTLSDLNAYLASQAAQFTTASGVTTDSILSVTIDDGGNTGSGGPLSATQSVRLMVDGVNHAPTLVSSGLAVGIIEDQGTAGAGFGDPIGAFTGGISDLDASAVSGIAITSVDSSHGAWFYSTNGGSSWTAVGTVSAGSALLLADDGNTRLYFQPAANFNGTLAGALTIKAWDQTSGANGSKVSTLTGSPTSGAFSSATDTVSVTVDAVNDAPVASGTAALGASLEDGTPTSASVASLFAARFSDSADAVSGGSSANALAGIAITGYTATAAGSWESSNDGGTTWAVLADVTGDTTAVTLQAITLLRFNPAAGYNGTPPVLTVRLIDDSVAVVDGDVVDVSTNGADTAFSAASINLGTSINAVNDAPTGTAKAVTILEDATRSFSAADFGFSDATDSPANTLLAVKLTTLPTAGTLTLNGTAVTAGQSIAAASLGQLVYTPGANGNGSGYASFTFQVQDNGGTANGGVDLDPTARSFTFNVTAVNDAPIGTATAVTINEDTTRSFSPADFGFSDASDSPANTLLAVKLTALPTAGTLTLNGNAVSAGQSIAAASLSLLMYHPGTNGNGTGYASFTFQVQDNGGTANGGIDVDPTARTFTFNVNAVNDAPTGTASAALVAGTEDTPHVVSASDLLAGFSDVDTGDLLSVSGLSADHGTVTDNHDGTFTITPALDYNGSVALSYSVIDGHGGSVAASQSFTLAAVNDAPVGTASASLASGTEDTPYVVSASDLLAGFSDVDTGDVLSVSGLSADHGTVTDNHDGTFTITPALDYNGPVSLSYSVIDDHGGSVAASQSFTLAAVNDAPTGTATAVTINEDTTRSFSAADFGFSDSSDSPGNTLSAIKLTTLPTAGTLTLNGNAVSAGDLIAAGDLGQLLYTPGLNGHGTGYASFTFQVQDNGGTANGGVDRDPTARTFTFNVSAVNDAPTGTASAALAAGTEDTASVVSASDLLAGFSDVDTGDMLSVSNLTADHGTVTDNHDGTFTITPALNYNGPVALSYSVIDGHGGSVAASQSFTLAAVNDAPVGVDDAATTAEDTAVAVDVLANDHDVDGPTLLIASARVTPEQGTVAVVNGQLRFTPAANFNGVATIHYTAGDGSLTSAERSVTVTVTPVNDAPTWSAPDAVQAAQDTPVEGQLPVAQDVEGDALSYAKATDPAHGRVTVTADGHYVYTPAAGFSGQDAFEVSVDDGHGGVTRQTVVVNVSAAPSVRLATASDLGASDHDGVTSANTITLQGEAVAGQTLHLYAPQGQLLGTVVADAQGHWALADVAIANLAGDATGARAGAEGAYTFAVRSVTAAGGESAPSTLTVTREIPPTVLAPSPSLVVAAPAAEAPASEAPASRETGPAIASSGGAIAEALRDSAAAGVPALTATAPLTRTATESDIYTRASGFQVMVSPASEPALKLFRGIDDQVVPMGRTISVQVPADAFVHTVLTETVTLSATRADGQPLPSWLSFDGKTGTFVGEPPAGPLQDLAIRLTARDSQGREVTTMFRIHVADGALTKPTSRAGFTQQLARGEALMLKPGQRAWQAQPRQLTARRA